MASPRGAALLGLFLVALALPWGATADGLDESGCKQVTSEDQLNAVLAEAKTGGKTVFARFFLTG